MTRYQRLFTATLSVVALVIGMVALPATAETGAGEVAIEGEAFFPEFPSYDGSGTFSGSVVDATLAGTDDRAGTEDWSVQASGGEVSASFYYDDPSCLYGFVYAGYGTIDVGGVAGGTVDGTYGDRDVTGLHADFSFYWNRIGTQAQVGASVTVDLTFDDGGPSPIQVITPWGDNATGEAAIVPIPSDPVAFEEACSFTGPPVAITAEVAAAVEVLTDH